MPTQLRSAPQEAIDFRRFVPEELRDLADPQRDLPRIAKDRRLTSAIECALPEIPTTHRLHNLDSRRIDFLAPESVHLVVTSPPYWTLKQYRESDGQLGWIEDYEEFVRELDKVWRRCFKALVPGGRLVCVVGDVCLSRRSNRGRHIEIDFSDACVLKTDASEFDAFFDRLVDQIRQRNPNAIP